MNIGDIIYQISFDTNDNITNKLPEALGVKGIWVLLGKNNEQDSFEFLNVGVTKDIGKELIYDVSCLHLLSYDTLDGDEPYINQFAVNLHMKCKSGYTQEYVYPHIRTEYTTLVFLYVYDEFDKNVEKQIAWITKAKYWRNNRPFKRPNNNYYLKNCGKFLAGNNCFHETKKLGNIISELSKYGIYDKIPKKV